MHDTPVICLIRRLSHFCLWILCLICHVFLLSLHRPFEIRLKLSTPPTDDDNHGGVTVSRQQAEVIDGKDASGVPLLKDAESSGAESSGAESFDTEFARSDSWWSNSSTSTYAVPSISSISTLTSTDRSSFNSNEGQVFTRPISNRSHSDSDSDSNDSGYFGAPISDNELEDSISVSPTVSITVSFASRPDSLTQSSDAGQNLPVMLPHPRNFTSAAKTGDDESDSDKNHHNRRIEPHYPNDQARQNRRGEFPRDQDDEHSEGQVKGRGKERLKRYVLKIMKLIKAGKFMTK